MKALRLTVLVVDHDEVGAKGAADEIESANYGNDCIAPRVLRVDEADIGKWRDGHPLNSAKTQDAEVARLFGDAHADAAMLRAALSDATALIKGLHAGLKQLGLSARSKDGEGEAALRRVLAALNATERYAPPEGT